MFYTCVAIFDVTSNLEKFLVFGSTEQDLIKQQHMQQDCSTSCTVVPKAISFVFSNYRLIID